MMIRISDMPEFKDKANRVLTMEADTPLANAIKLMADNNYGSVVVTKNDKLVGIFTERDVLRRVSAKNKDLKKTKLADVMTKNPCTATQDDLVTDSMRRMSQGRFRHLPVVDEDKKVVGILSQGDFVALTLSDAAKRFSQTAKASLSVGYQPVLIIIGVTIYTIVLLSFLGS